MLRVCTKVAHIYSASSSRPIQSFKEFFGLPTMGNIHLLSVWLIVCYAVVCSGWLFGSRNCFCKAVNNHDYNHVLRDFGSIQSCRRFPRCACRRAAMMTCGTECERKVQEWVCHHNCGGNNIGANIRASYQASTCHSNRGRDVFVCGQRSNCGH